MEDSETETIGGQLYGMGLYVKHHSRLSVLLSSLSILVSFTSFILTVNILTRPKDNLQLIVSENGGLETLCIPQGLVSDQQLYHQIKNQTQRSDGKLCFEDNDKLSYLLSQMLQMGLNRTVGLNKAFSLPVGHSPSVTAHLYLKPAIEKKIDSESHQHLTLSLSKDFDPAVEHVRGSEVTLEGLHILYTGIYFVYSNINFKKTSAASKQQPLFYYVKRESPNHPYNSGVLMRSAYTPCQDCREFEETSFKGGVFYLQQGDYIRVCLSSDDDVVHFDTPATSVGLVMLSSNR